MLILREVGELSAEEGSAAISDQHDGARLLDGDLLQSGEDHQSGLNGSEAWDDNTIQIFGQKLKQYKQTAESYKAETIQEEAETTTNYKVTFIEPDGSVITKSFDRVERSNRGSLLYNQISHSLDSMGHAISEQEKRQIIMDILKNLC